MSETTAKVALITGANKGIGLETARQLGKLGVTILVGARDLKKGEEAAEVLRGVGVDARAVKLDVVNEADRTAVAKYIEKEFGRLDILINNAANNPKIEAGGAVEFSRLEHFPLEQWNDDLAVGLTGAFICSQVFGAEMARRGSGVIVNIASDLALIGPYQRIYQQPGIAVDSQPVKPITYSVVKSALVGMTRYLATYWAGQGVRVNALSPGGVYAGQPDEFVAKLTNLIPMGRMADVDEYQGAIIFLCSDASSYMTGSNLIIEGGRTCW